MDEWAWEQLQPWLDTARSSQSVRCSASSPDRPADAHGQTPPCAPSSDTSLRRPACAAASPPTNCATAHAVQMAREGVPLIVIQRQLGHTSLGGTSIYLQGIDSAEIIDAVHARRAPMTPVDASLRL
jgi:integrase